MNIFDVIKQLYTSKDCKWIKNIDDIKELHPLIITKFLAMNKKISKQVKLLDGYCFILSNKEFLYYAWSILPKYSTAPFCKYIKKEKNIKDEFDFIWKKFKNYTNIKGNEFYDIKPRLEQHLKQNMLDWFLMLGIEKKYYKKYKIKIEPEKQKCVGLGAWL